MDPERLEVIIRQLKKAHEGVRTAAEAAGELRLLRQARNEERGAAWRCGERLSIGLSDAEHVLSFLVDWLEIGDQPTGATREEEMMNHPPPFKGGFRVMNCPCGRPHKNWRVVAHCLWPRAVWVQGDGQWATLAWCRTLSVVLHATAGDARKALETIQLTGCGGDCKNDHEIVVISPENLSTRPVALPEPAGDAPPPVRLDPQRNFSGAQKQEIYLRCNGHCVSCGQPLDSDWHADHIVPHSRGGRTEVVDGHGLCQPCNSRKRAKVLTVDE